MLARVPPFENLPEHLPIFPLAGALLLPFGRLPLNIFEPRYLAMIEDALSDGRHIGIIQPDQAAPKRNSGPGLHRVGCAGRLVSFTETDDGRYLITLGGVIRFGVADEVAMRRGYRRVRTDYAPFVADMDAPEEPAPFDRERLYAALRLYFSSRGIDANWDALDEMDNATLVVTLAMGCPFEPLEKQALLEAQSFADRARTLMALLSITAHDAPDGSASSRYS